MVGENKDTMIMKESKKDYFKQHTLDRHKEDKFFNCEDMDTSSGRDASTISPLKSDEKVATSEHKDLASDGKLGTKDSLNSHLL